MNKHQKTAEVVYLLLAAVGIMLLATRSSLLYPCNDWNDANSYFSVGKALFHGKMPYRDVFDQKGMYLYFFYGLCYLIEHTSFRGVFLMEILLAFLDMVGFFNILKLYIKKELALVLAPLTLAVCFCSWSFYYGGSAEELCLPFLIWGLYLGVRYFKQEYPFKTMSWKTLLFAGILAGMIANIKFTVLGMFFGWMLMVACSYVARKDFIGALKACGIFLLGMMLPFLPWLIYFALRRGLYDWYWGYVYVNVFLYSNLNGQGPSLGERIYTLAKILYNTAWANPSYYVFLIPGFFYGMAGMNHTKEKKSGRWLSCLFVPVLAFFLFLGIYIGGSELPYYALPLCVFTVFGFALLGRVLELCFIRKEWRISWWIPGAGTMACSILLVLALSMNIPFMKEKREDFFLFQFRDVVLETEDPTLLNVGCLDAGLYTVCDIVPTCRWFQTQTINNDIVYEEQKSYIKEGKTDYVIARDGYPDRIGDHYELAAQASSVDQGIVYDWYLFRLKK